MIRVNGAWRESEAEPDTPLLHVLRNDFGLDGPKFGCGLGQCGACTVLVEGEAVRSCITPLEAVEGAEITTLEGLGNRAAPHALQSAFIRHQAMQCGYCSNGMIMAAAALLRRNPDPSDAEIVDALAGNLCRCAVHMRILAAVRDAAKELRDGGR